MANCCICGTKLGFMQGKIITYSGVDATFCEMCENSLESLRNFRQITNETILNEVLEKKVYFDRYIQQGAVNERIAKSLRQNLDSAGKSIEEYRTQTELERQKREYADSFNEFYEYDVVTIINEGHGQVNKSEMMTVLSEHAKNGWKLHSIYSNELGKNALMVLGFGVNSTACEDVLIFERRVAKDMH